MAIYLKFDFRCKACSKFKKPECPTPELAKPDYGCKNHSVFSSYEKTLEKTKGYIDALKGGVFH